MEKLELKNINEYKFVGSDGGIRYLIVDHEEGIVSTDYYLHNGGHRPCKMVQLKELRRLENYYINIIGYKLVD